jgi:hypothetical protein
MRPLSNFNDALTGDNHSNIINGGLGNDMLNGGGGWGDCGGARYGDDYQRDA